jgi:hypothetical protein
MEINRNHGKSPEIMEITGNQEIKKLVCSPLGKTIYGLISL